VVGHLVAALWLAALAPGKVVQQSAVAPQPQGEAVAVTGRVIEVGSERPIAGARLVVGEQEVFSDAQGRFRLTLRPGRWTLEVESRRHLSDRLEIDVSRGAPEELLVLLVETDRFRETVVVAAGSEPSTSPPPLPVRPIDVMGQAGVADNVFRSLQTLAGVAAVNEFDSRIAVRGGGPDQNLTVMDGIEIHNPYRLFGLTSAFNPETVSDFELTSGAFGVRHGDRLSSLLVVQNRLGTIERGFSGSTSMSVTDANLILEGELPGSAPGSWLVTGRRTYYDLVAERIVEDDLPSFGDLQAKLYRELGSGSRLTFTGLVSRESTDGSFAGDDEVERADVSTAARNDLASLAFDKPLGDSSGSLRTIASWYRFVDSIDFDGRLESDSRVSIASDGRQSGLLDVIFRRDVEVEDLSLRQELTLVPDSRHLIDTGFELHSLRTRWGWEIPGDRNPSVANGSSVQGGAALPDLLDSRVDSTRFGAWLADRFQITPRLVVEPGLRLDHSSLIGRTRVAPRLSARFELMRDTRLRIAGGLHTQSPGYEKLFQADYFVDLSEASGLGYESALHLVLGLERDLARGLTARVEGYFKDFRDLVIGRLETEPERLARISGYDFPEALAGSVPVEAEITSVAVNGSSGRAWGLDLYLTKRPVSESTRLSGWLSWAWGVADRDAYGRRYPFDYDRRHSVNLVGTWRLDQKLDLGITARWASGFPFTPARGVRAVAVEDPTHPSRLVPERNEDGNLVWSVDPGGASNLNSARLPDFARVDARLSFRPKGRSGRWLFYLEVINLLDRENAASIDYDIRFDEAGEPFIAGTRRDGGVPLLPTFGVRFRF
jgi:hypothetical protein